MRGAECRARRHRRAPEGLQSYSRAKERQVRIKPKKKKVQRKEQQGGGRGRTSYIICRTQCNFKTINAEH